MNIKSGDQRKPLTAALLATFCLASVVLAQSTVFTYQGRLTDTGSAASGNYDLQFKLFDTGTVGTGTQQGSTVMVSNVTVTAGVFTVQLDFGSSVFTGANRFLEIAVKLPNGATFTVLGPRQAVTATPYAIKSLNATAADSLSGACVNCVTSGQIQSLPTGSTAYIQNTTSLQAASNFKISGNGTVGGTLAAAIVDATTQYNIGGQRILSAPPTFNLFAGLEAGAAGAVGGANSFFGAASGLATTGGSNSFFGFATGVTNKTGRDNTLIGTYADVGSDSLINATAIGARARVDQSNSLVLGNIAGINNAEFSVNVGIGTTTPQAALHVNGAALVTTGNGREVSIGSPNTETGLAIKSSGDRADVRFDGAMLKLVVGSGTGPPPNTSGIAITRTGSVGIGTTSPFVNTKLDIVGGLLRLDQLATGGDEFLCRNSAFHTIATCNQSSLRYKESVQPLRQGLQLIQRLRPVTFSWKEGGRADLGLIAEEVAEVEPLLAFKNDKGEIEGVKYPQLNVVLINAVKEQQQMIERQQIQLVAQQKQIDELKRVVCRNQPRTRICK
jgi:hypothetical protein